MHSGVQQLVRWVDDNKDTLEVAPPASSADVASLEQSLGMPLPEDLKHVLMRFNGGELPSGQLLPAGTGPATIEGAMREFAGETESDFLDPELLLPFHRTVDGSILCFDRTSGPVSDTWPVVDYFEDTGETRLVYRTFDGWCRACVNEWTAPDFGEDFSLDKYLRQGERHAELEPDVSTAHATAAHAYRRAGRPEDALRSYLEAARCVPALPWCDWEALKLGVLLDMPKEALEAATRVSAWAPSRRWAERETTPAQVAIAMSRLAPQLRDLQPWVRLLDQLLSQAGEDELGAVQTVRAALLRRQSAVIPQSLRGEPVVTPRSDANAWWGAIRQAYYEGVLRDDDLVLDPSLDPLRGQFSFAELLRIRRDF